MYCNPPSSSVHGISQARMLEWVAISFSRGSSRPRDGTYVSHIDKQVLYFLSHQENPFRRNRRHKMLPVKVENKYKDLIYEQEETNRRKSLRKRNLLYMLHIKHIQLLLYFIYIWYWIGSLYSDFFFSSWDIQTVRCSTSYIYHFFYVLGQKIFFFIMFPDIKKMSLELECWWKKETWFISLSQGSLSILDIMFPNDYISISFLSVFFTLKHFIFLILFYF